MGYQTENNIEFKQPKNGIKGLFGKISRFTWDVFSILSGKTIGLNGINLTQERPDYRDESADDNIF